MPDLLVPGPEIWAGYLWTHNLVINTDPPSQVFPAGTRLRAEVRAAAFGKLLGELTTENGGLTIIDPNQVAMAIPGAFTDGVPQNVALDFIRTDGPQEVAIGVQLTISVRRPVTKPKAAP